MKRAIAALLVLSTSVSFAADLLGTWVHNAELSAEVQPRQKSSSGMFDNVSTGGSVFGLPIPLPGNGQAQNIGGAKNPDVLYCQTLTISKYDDKIAMTYGNLGAREFVPGKHLGRRTIWKGRKLSESYSTMSRKVKQEYTLKSDDRMLVTVTLNPKGSRKLVYKRIFDRVTSPGAVAVEPEAS